MAALPCFGNVPLHQVPRTGCPRSLIPRAAWRRERWPLCRVPATLRCVSPLPCSAKMRYYITKPVARTTACHSEPPRMRRTEESTQAAEKWLQCNHTRVLIRKLYCNHTGSFDFAPCYSLGTSLRMTGGRRGGVSPLPCSAKMRYYITKPIARTAACRRCLIPRTGVIALHDLLRGQQYKCTPYCHFDRSEERNGEISHIVCMFLQCSLARIH